MAFYNSGIKTHVFDPILTLNNNRVEFQLPEGALYLSSLRIHNFGATMATAGAKLNNKAGIYSYIRNITLFDGSVVLDQLRSCSQWMAWKNTNRANRNQIGLDALKKGSDLGVILDATNDGKCAFPYPVPGVGITNNSSSRYTLNLREVLPFLRNTQYVPSMVFKNLRIVIELEIDTNSTLETNTNVASLVTLTDSLLVCDEVVNQQVVQQAINNWQGVSFSCIELDSFLSPSDTAVTAAGLSNVGKTSVILHGFAGKFVNRIMLMAVPTSTTAMVAASQLISAGGCRAVANPGEVIQIQLNGQNMFPGAGVSAPNQKTAMLHDTWGMFSCPPGSNLPGTFFQGVAASQIGGTAFQRQMISANGWFGCHIRNRVDSLQVDYSRLQYIPTGMPLPIAAGNTQGQNADITHNGSPTGHPAVGGQNIMVFAEIRKSVIMGPNGTYRVVYN